MEQNAIGANRKKHTSVCFMLVYNVSYFWQQISMDIGHFIIDRVGWKVRRQILFDSYSYTLIKPKLNPINWKLGPSVRKSRKYNRTFCEINLKMKLTQTEHSTLVIRSEFFNPKTVAITCHWSFVRNILVNLLHWSCKCILTLPENALKLHDPFYLYTYTLKHIIIFIIFSFIFYLHYTFQSTFNHDCISIFLDQIGYVLGFCLFISSHFI